MLTKLEGPFGDAGARGFLGNLPHGAAVHLYQTFRTASGQEVPDHLGWFRRIGPRFDADTRRGLSLGGLGLELDDAVYDFLELEPEYVVHDA